LCGQWHPKGTTLDENGGDRSQTKKGNSTREWPEGEGKITFSSKGEKKTKGDEGGGRGDNRKEDVRKKSSSKQIRA